MATRRTADRAPGIAAAVAAVPGLSAAVVDDLAALLACVHAACPEATTVLGGSLGSAPADVGAAPAPDAARGAGAPRAEPRDIDLFVVLPTRRAVVRALRSRPFRAALEALRLARDAELVFLWRDLVRRGRTPLYGRVVTGDPTLAAEIARTPAPPLASILATAHLFLIESLLEPERAERLCAKAALTGVRARLAAEGARPTMAALFAPEATAAALAAADERFPPLIVRLASAALARRPLRQTPVAHGAPAEVPSPAALRACVLELLTGLGPPPPVRRLRQRLRHLGARLHFGLAPRPLADPMGCFLAACRALVAASLVPDEEAATLDGAAGAAADPLLEAERALARLLDLEPAGGRAERRHRAARALAAYGRYYPHKILLPAPPPVPPPSSPSAAIVSFVIPVKDGAATLPPLLASIARQEAPPGYEIETIVVDNGSTDGSADVARHLGAIVEVDLGRGASPARNTGIRRARGDVLIFVDADAFLLGRDFVHHVLRVFARAPGVGMVGTAIECDPAADALGRADHMVCFFNWQATHPAGERHFQPTAVLAVRRAVCDAIGGFATELVNFYDFDFCRRAREQGWTLYFEPRARVAHTPREGLAGIVRHSYSWGWNVARVYAPYDPAHRWRFLDRPVLFAANVPFHVANRIWLIGKRWVWRRPRDTLALFPLWAMLLGAWGAGVAIGGYRWIKSEGGTRAE